VVRGGWTALAAIEEEALFLLTILFLTSRGVAEMTNEKTAQMELSARDLDLIWDALYGRRAQTVDKGSYDDGFATREEYYELMAKVRSKKNALVTE
jgi:hypothetical protein